MPHAQSQACILGALAFLVLLWLVAEPTVFRSSTFFGLRDAMVQLTGFVAIGCMSLAMVPALRPRWPEAWLGGLDKMYCMHKWLGISVLVVAIIHGLWAQGPKWAVGWGWLEPPDHGAQGAPENPMASLLASQRGAAESVGEWVFYAVVVLIALALIRRFPYHLFYKTHRLLAVGYLALVFHAVVLMEFHHWATPIGWLAAVLLACGSWAAIVVLLRRVGARSQVAGRITALHLFAGVDSLEIETEVQGWPGHKSGQFAFLTAGAADGAHPYTIASGWRQETSRITFVVKDLGDHTHRLHEKLRVVEQAVRVEGPYGCFTFDDGCARQIWIGGGIGITPFIGRMKHMAWQKEDRDWPEGQKIDLFHSTADVDDEALDRLAGDARSADVRLHVLIDARDDRLTGERIRAVVPEWREASIWFCGPAGFGEALKHDLARHGFPVERRFHQELFAMR
ncbi:MULTISPECIES: ferredoxin reductase family protein [unclassified Rhodanobacter]|uniref:ferredoxin reductase family protein n=1 Tax=unclassified Rhodanobacter TaxID=2621553 RepID=UPI002100CF1E|nr:ferric reductase-like transmembrane domain-containing protein [Rhodanobacter sp. OR444]